MTTGNCDIVDQEIQTWEAGALFMLVCITACCSLFKLPTWSPKIIVCQSRFINFIDIFLKNQSHDHHVVDQRSSVIHNIYLFNLGSELLLHWGCLLPFSWQWSLKLLYHLIGKGVEAEFWLTASSLGWMLIDGVEFHKNTRNVIRLSWWRCQHKMKACPIKRNFCPLKASMIVQVKRIWECLTFFWVS